MGEVGGSGAVFYGVEGLTIVQPPPTSLLGRHAASSKTTAAAAVGHSTIDAAAGSKRQDKDKSVVRIRQPIIRDSLRTRSKKGVPGSRRHARWMNDQLALTNLRRVMFESGDDLTDTDGECEAAAPIVARKQTKTWKQLRDDVELFKAFRNRKDDILLERHRSLREAHQETPHGMSETRLENEVIARFRRMQKLLMHGGFVQYYIEDLERLVRNYAAAWQADAERVQMDTEGVTASGGTAPDSDVKSANGMKSTITCLKNESDKTNVESLLSEACRGLTFRCRPSVNRRRGAPVERCSPIAAAPPSSELASDATGSLDDTESPQISGGLLKQVPECDMSAEERAWQVRHPNEVLVWDADPLVRMLGHHMADIYNLKSRSVITSGGPPPLITADGTEEAVASAAGRGRRRTGRRKALPSQTDARGGGWRAAASATGQSKHIPKVWILGGKASSIAAAMKTSSSSSSYPIVPPFKISELLFRGGADVRCHSDGEDALIPSPRERMDQRTTTAKEMMKLPTVVGSWTDGEGADPIEDSRKKAARLSELLSTGCKEDSAAKLTSTSCGHCGLPLLIGESGLNIADVQRDPIISAEDSGSSSSSRAVFCSIPCLTLHTRRRRLEAAAADN